MLYKYRIRAIMVLAIPRGTADGGVAQLGERSVRIREVEGSNPFVSTIEKDIRLCGCPFLSRRDEKFMPRRGKSLRLHHNLSENPL